MNVCVWKALIAENNFEKRKWNLLYSLTEKGFILFQQVNHRVGLPFQNEDYCITNFFNLKFFYSIIIMEKGK